MNLNQNNNSSQHTFNQNTFNQNNLIQNINLLNDMYNNNNIQIRYLQNSNNDIINMINSFEQQLNYRYTQPQPPLQPQSQFTRQHQIPRQSRQPVNNNRQPSRQPTRQQNNQQLYDIQFFIPSDLSFNLNGFFDPIDIFPTQSQIEIALQNINFGDIEHPLNLSCPISLTRFNANSQVSRIRHCKHIFNTTEINRWFSNNCKCPVCRYDIRTYIPNIPNIPNISEPEPIPEPINETIIEPTESEPTESEPTESEPTESEPINSHSESTQISNNRTPLHRTIHDLLQDLLTPTQVNLVTNVINNAIDPSNNIISNILQNR